MWVSGMGRDPWVCRKTPLFVWGGWVGGWWMGERDGKRPVGLEEDISVCLGWVGGWVGGWVDGWVGENGP